MSASKASNLRTFSRVSGISSTTRTRILSEPDAIRETLLLEPFRPSGLPARAPRSWSRLLRPWRWSWRWRDNRVGLGWNCNIKVGQNVLIGHGFGRNRSIVSSTTKRQGHVDASLRQPLQNQRLLLVDQ